MTVRMCGICGATDESIAIIRWRPQEKYLYLDYCPKCLKEKKARYKREGYTKEDGYDI